MPTATKRKVSPAQAAALAEARQVLAERRQVAAMAEQTVVPVVSTEEVESIQAELARLRMENAALQSKEANRPHFGLPVPEPADAKFATEEMLSGFDDLDPGHDRRKHWGRENRMGYKPVANSINAGVDGGMDFAPAHVPAERIWVYDRKGQSRVISAQGYDYLAAGLYPVCPKCHAAGLSGYHKESELNPNACPSRNKVAVAYCPVCLQNGVQRPIYDDLPDRDGARSATVNDPQAINLNLVSTPEERLKVKMLAHIQGFHDMTAAAMSMPNSLLRL